MAEDKDVEKTIAEDLVVTKYKMAGEIVNREFNIASHVITNFFINIVTPLSNFYW